MRFLWLRNRYGGLQSVNDTIYDITTLYQPGTTVPGRARIGQSTCQSSVNQHVNQHVNQVKKSGWVPPTVRVCVVQCYVSVNTPYSGIQVVGECQAKYPSLRARTKMADL